MLVPAFLTHACLGAPYGWSAVTSALTREQVFRCRRVAHLLAEYAVVTLLRKHKPATRGSLSALPVTGDLIWRPTQ